MTDRTKAFGVAFLTLACVAGCSGRADSNTVPRGGAGGTSGTSGAGGTSGSSGVAALSGASSIGGDLSGRGGDVSGIGGLDATGGVTAITQTGGNTALGIDPSGGSTVNHDPVFPHEAGTPWRTSGANFCPAGGVQLFAYGPFSDPRGVFMLTQSGNDALSLFRNEGSGWTEAPTTLPNAPVGLTGFPQGSLLAYGASDCGVEFIDGTTVTCSEAGPNAWPAFVVDAATAYAWRENSLLKYDGQIWSEQAQAPGFQAYSLWAQADRAWVGTSDGQVLAFVDGVTTPTVFSGLGSGMVSALWGFAADDIYAGTESGGVYHFDGTGWTQRVATAGDCPGIRGMWGADNVLFYRTRGSLVQLRDGDEVIPIIDVPCVTTFSDGVSASAEITGLWGNSPNEVFIATREWQVVPRMNPFAPGTQSISAGAGTCSTVGLLWFDGVSVSPL